MTAESEEFREYAKDLGNCVLQMIARLKMATNNCWFVIKRMTRLAGVSCIEDAANVLNYYNKSINRKEECMVCLDCSANTAAPCGHKLCHKCWMTMFRRQAKRAKREGLDPEFERGPSEQLVSDNDDNFDDDGSADAFIENRFDDDIPSNADTEIECDDLEGFCPFCDEFIPTGLLKAAATPVHDSLIQKLNRVKKSEEPAGETDSTKMKKLKSLVAKHISKTKMIIVSQSIPMLDYVHNNLEKLYPGQILRIDGKRKVEQRVEDIREFQDAKSNKKIMLFSLTCNPEGITLTRATVLIHLDHWWNKGGKVAQINDRIYRISQDKPTTIYYLYIDGTIENKIFQLQDHKDQLINYEFDNLVDKPRLIS